MGYRYIMCIRPPATGYRDTNLDYTRKPVVIGYSLENQCDCSRVEMSRRFYNLPSLTALATFEAVARHLSITSAATELGVTPGAVSRQIKALESELEITLLHKRSNVVSLTDSALALHTAISAGFTQIAEVVGHIRKDNSINRVTIASPVNTGPLWLMPMMPEFWNKHPDIEVNHRLATSEREYTEPDVDLKIRYGTGDWTGESMVRLFNVMFFPVSSPEFAHTHKNTSAGDLPSLTLLRAEPSGDTIQWEDFFRLAGISHGVLQDRELSSYAMALQACQAGQGVMIGWSHVIQNQLCDGSLVPFTTLNIEDPNAYYLAWNEGTALSPAAISLRDWLIGVTRP